MTAPQWRAPRTLTDDELTRALDLCRSAASASQGSVAGHFLGQLRDLLGPAPAQPTADELWAWLLACTTCGREHQFRQADPPSSGWTWAADDGHGYHNPLGPRLVRMRERWDALRGAESRSAALAGEAPPEPGSGRSGEPGRQDGASERDAGEGT